MMAQKGLKQHQVYEICVRNILTNYRGLCQSKKMVGAKTEKEIEGMRENKGPC